MKKFFTFAVVVLMASLSFGEMVNFHSLSEKEMERRFVEMADNNATVEVVATRWAEVINKAFETQNNKLIGSVLRAMTRALNSFEKHRATRIGSELNLQCKEIMILLDTSTDKQVVSLILWDSRDSDWFFLPIEYKTSSVTGKMPSVSKDTFK